MSRARFERLDCFIVRVEPEMREAIERHRRRCRRVLGKDVSLAAAARNLIGASLRRYEARRTVAADNGQLALFTRSRPC